ncbi:hypothetical protein JTB14_031713 [Gonioctena quinquepunctata]|nr:hypothetical protein JTB14_031713 [Gonioctena quinquepunctata]
MALAINEKLNFEKKLGGFNNLLRDRNRTHAELRPVELPINDPVASTSRNNISGYPIHETDMVDENPEDVELPGDDTIPKYLDSHDSVEYPDFVLSDQEKGRSVDGTRGSTRRRYHFRLGK